MCECITEVTLSLVCTDILEVHTITVSKPMHRTLTLQGCCKVLAYDSHE